MEYFQYSGDSKKKTLIALLVHANQADHRNHSNEIRFIESIGASLGLTQDEIYDIRQGNHDFIIDIPKSEEERMMFFMHVMHLIKVDGDIAKQEEELAKELAFRLGINPLLIQELLDAYHKEIQTGTGLSSQDMTEMIRKYLN